MVENKQLFDTVALRTFEEIWQRCFSFVKIRKYKACSGKCLTCAILTTLRRAHKGNKARNELKFLYNAHRSLYMGERILYQERVKVEYTLINVFV